MSEQYVFVTIFFLLTAVFACAPLALAWIFSPKKSSPRKRETYESGLRTYGKTWIEFKPQYYLYALAYVIFGVEAVLLLHWDVSYTFLPLYSVIDATLFLLMLGFGLVYVWQKGWLHWM